MSLIYRSLTDEISSSDEIDGEGFESKLKIHRIDSLSLSESLLPTENIENIDDDGERSIQGQYLNDSGESDNSKCSYLPSSESNVSSLSEVSSCDSSIDFDGKGTADNETQSKNQLPIAFFKTLLPWKQKSSLKTVPLNNSPRSIDKIGGTLALIQYSRPPNLPVKNPTEELCHRKQYHIILEEAKKREVREEDARRRHREQQLKREERLSSDSCIWLTQILPRFESLKDSKKVRELWWCGLPPSIRGKVWKLGISNDLNIESNDYEVYLRRLNCNPVNESLSAIKLDVSRTFTNLGLFQEGGPLFDALQGVLAAYTVYRSDVGYVQGMSFLGAILTLNMEPNDAFVCFANLLNNPCHRAAFTLNQKQMNVYYQVFSSALAHKLPKIHIHFHTSGLSPDLYLLDWLYTIYAKAMPFDVTCRVWDVFIRDGDEFLFRTALGILHMYEDELLSMDFIRCAQFLNKLPENLQATELFDNIRQMTTRIGTRSFQDIVSELS